MAVPAFLVILFTLSLSATSAMGARCGPKVWVFGAITDVFPLPPGADKGELIGHALEEELVTAVCTIANKMCTIIPVPADTCMMNVRDMWYVGNGLLDGSVDACLQVTITLERAMAGLFTFPYSDPGKRGIYVKSGNPYGVDPNGGDFKIGYFDVSFGGIQCLNRVGRVFTDVQGFKYNAGVIQGLLNDEVEAAILGSGANIDGLEEIGEPFNCEILGTAIMARKGSRLPLWFNQAFKELVQSGGYKDICDAVVNPSEPCLKKIKKVIHQFGKTDAIVNSY